MTEFILELAALLIVLFCTIKPSGGSTLRSDRHGDAGEIFSGLLKEILALPVNRHMVYCMMSWMLLLSTVLSIVENLGRILGISENALQIPQLLYRFCHPVFLFIFVCYMFILLFRSFLSDKRLQSDGLAVLPFFTLSLIGVLLQTMWEVRVELFFEAVSLLGCMLLIEEKDAVQGKKIRTRSRSSVMIVIALSFLAVITMNIRQILSLSNARSDEIGTIQLDVIRSELQDIITEAETNVLRVAIGAEQLLESGASFETLTEYFNGQVEKYLSDKNFMNTYIAGSDWHIVPGFDAPEDFHAAERIWYLGAKDHPGEVFISEPYMDAKTGTMCFTVSTMLSDDETVVGMDLNFTKAQESILQMTQESDRTAMIVTEGGLIAGYTDMSLVGERADEKLPEYADILRRVTSSQEHGSFRVNLDGHPCMIFSSETSNNWYLILSVDTSTFYRENYQQIVLLGSVNLLMLAVIVIYYMLSVRKNRYVEEVLSKTQNRISRFSVRLHESAAHLLRLGDIRLFREGTNPAELIGQVHDSGQHLSLLADDFDHYLEESGEKEKSGGNEEQGEALKAPSRKVRNGIIIAMLVSLVIVLGFSITISVNQGTIRMNRETDHYEYRLNEWITQQKSILYMFTDIISSRPELMEDYDKAVHWLDDISRNYEDIAVCYMANPYAENTIIMSNGWNPGEAYRPETRPWYRATERSAEDFSISAPYSDAKTGKYCITLSRVVYGEKGEFLGIFGIDFFLDDLIHILGESYTSKSYAFLVDSEGSVINHPNEKYQINDPFRMSIEDTEYAEVYNREKVTLLRDYTGHYMVCLARKMDFGFTVLVANRCWDVYKSVFFVPIFLMVLFGVCLAFVVSLLNRLIRWQKVVNHQLVDAAKAAESANRAKSRFLSQMSHEIRTPMNAIIGLDNIALRDESISPGTRDNLEKINTSARHLLSLINDILDMSRIESGRMTLKEEPFSFRDFLDQICIIIHGQCQEKGLDFVCNRIGTFEDSYVGDDLKLRQVVINILGNSVKFTDPPGIVTFSVEQINGGGGISSLDHLPYAGSGQDAGEEDVDGKAANGGSDNRETIRFTMEDTGIGMDKEFIPTLFEAFSQEDSNNTTRYGGSGLGMAITRSLVEMMDGEIRVESEKGLGSTFIVTVSLGRVQESEIRTVDTREHPDSIEEISLKGLHFLIAEDQEMNAEVLTDLLELEDMTSEWARNGQQALEVFRGSEEGHFDAILMDMRMPVMDGLTATMEIRRLNRPDVVTIPIIALTANAFEEDVKQCLQAGMNAHLSKPVDMELLKETLRRLIVR